MQIAGIRFAGRDEEKRALSAMQSYKNKKGWLWVTAQKT